MRHSYIESSEFECFVNGQFSGWFIGFTSNFGDSIHKLVIFNVDAKCPRFLCSYPVVWRSALFANQYENAFVVQDRNKWKSTNFVPSSVYLQLDARSHIKCVWLAFLSALLAIKKIFFLSMLMLSGCWSLDSTY